MSFSGPEFKFDLFVSHSHGVDHTGSSLWLDWSKRFVAELRQQLKARRAVEGTNPVEVFFDDLPRESEGLDRLDGIADQLEWKARGSAMLLVLLAPHLLRSEWCAKERGWWVAEQEERRMSPAKRVAIVRIHPTDKPPGGWPSGLADDKGEMWPGFWLYDREGGTDVFPFGWTQATDERLKDEVIEVMKAIRVNLRDLTGELEVRRRRDKGLKRLGARKQIIYLHGRPEDAQLWDKARGDLREHGFRVVPGGPDPIPSDLKDRKAARQYRAETIGESDALLLVGTENVPALWADITTVGMQDLEEARRLSDRPLPGAILDMAVSDQRARQRDRAEDLGFGWIPAAEPPLSDKVQEWLAGAATE